MGRNLEHWGVVVVVGGVERGLEDGVAAFILHPATTKQETTGNKTNQEKLFHRGTSRFRLLPQVSNAF